MARISALTAHLDALLNSGAFTDSSRNGVQVDGGDRETDRVALAVDGGLSIIERAIAAHAHLIVVHHGILWGVEQAIVGPFGRKVGALLAAQTTLYASHLPLDAHPDVGNNAELARAVELTDLTPYMPYKGALLGVRGRCSPPRPREWFHERAATFVGATTCRLLPFGPPTINSVGIVTGSGTLALEETARLGLDLLITGEPKQSAYHDAQELGLNVLFAGHYATETFGVRALGERLKRDFGVEPLFIDEPTGI